MIGSVKAERWRIPVTQVFVAMLIALVLFSRSRWNDRAPGVAIALFAAGVVLAAVGALGRTWCSMYIAGHKGRALVTGGPYSVCRHPLYLFSLIGGVGLGLTARSLTVPLILLAGFGTVYSPVIGREEEALRQAFGRDYDDYARATPRFLPKLSLLREPREHVVDPRVFRAHLLSTVWFLWLIALVAVVEALHDGHVLPAALALY